jgi:hypothetical protein
VTLKLTIFLEEPPGLDPGKVDGLGRHVRPDDVARHQQVDLVLELSLGVFVLALQKLIAWCHSVPGNGSGYFQDTIASVT